MRFLNPLKMKKKTRQMAPHHRLHITGRRSPLTLKAKMSHKYHLNSDLPPNALNSCQILLLLLTWRLILPLNILKRPFKSLSPSNMVWQGHLASWSIDVNDNPSQCYPNPGPVSLYRGSESWRKCAIETQIPSPSGIIHPHSEFFTLFSQCSPWPWGWKWHPRKCKMEEQRFTPNMWNLSFFFYW